jgi:hypothetical protein
VRMELQEFTCLCGQTCLRIGCRVSSFSLNYCLASADCRMLNQVGDGVNPVGEVASLRIGGIHGW